jgi:hypothetical protein
MGEWEKKIGRRIWLNIHQITSLLCHLSSTLFTSNLLFLLNIQHHTRVSGSRPGEEKGKDKTLFSLVCLHKVEIFFHFYC